MYIMFNAVRYLYPHCRSSESVSETKGLFRTHNHEEDNKSGGRMLRHFFDDWPRTVQEQENPIDNASPGTSLSISVTGNSSSDISLKLSTGGNMNGTSPDEGHVKREPAHLNWVAPSGWGTNQMGGPLAEALRSSASTPSPTSVLHQLRGQGSFITTWFLFVKILNKEMCYFSLFVIWADTELVQIFNVCASCLSVVFNYCLFLLLDHLDTQSVA